MGVEAFGRPRREVDAGADPHELGERADGQRGEAQPVAAPVAHEAVERLEARGGRPLHDQQHGPPVVQAAGGERERLHGRQVGPLGVVDDDEQRPLATVVLGETEDDLADGQRVGAGAVAMEGGRGGEPGRGGLAEQLVDDAEVELALELVATRPQHDRVGRHHGRDGARQRRLPHARLAFDQDQLGGTVQRPFDGDVGRRRAPWRDRRAPPRRVRALRPPDRRRGPSLTRKATRSIRRHPSRPDADGQACAAGARGAGGRDRLREVLELGDQRSPLAASRRRAAPRRAGLVAERRVVEQPAHRLGDAAPDGPCASRLRPAPRAVTRAALSAWSRPWWRTTSGTPAASARTTVPWPPWVTTAAACASTASAARRARP